MNGINEALNKFTSIYSIYLAVVIVFIGVFLILYDGRRNRIRRLEKEAKVCNGLGWIYIVGGICLYIFALVV